MGTTIEAPLAKAWIERWDVQQERYVADREERFTVIADVVEHVARERDRPTIVDLGCGPGSLSDRLADRIPGADIVGVDADPLLLGLGRSHYDRFRLVEADLLDTDWPSKAKLSAQVDAAVSTTALHWIDADRLSELYGRLARLIRPGGVFVNADHCPAGSPGLDELAQHVRDSRADRVGVAGNEEWGEWWHAVLADRGLAGLVDERSQRAIAHGGTNGLSAAGQADLLRVAGFSEVGTVWQSGDDTVLVALR